MDGAFALKKIEELHPDVVTLDLEMPRMDGMRTLRIIMRSAPMPVILLSTPPKKARHSLSKLWLWVPSILFPSRKMPQPGTWNPSRNR